MPFLMCSGSSPSSSFFFLLLGRGLFGVPAASAAAAPSAAAMALKSGTKRCEQWRMASNPRLTTHNFFETFSFGGFFSF